MLEDDLWWKMTFGGRRPLVEDHFWWKTTFGGRQPLVEDDLWWKTAFGGKRLLVEDDPCMLPSPLCGIFICVLCLVICVVFLVDSSNYNWHYLVGLKAIRTNLFC